MADANTDWARLYDLHDQPAAAKELQTA